MPPIVSVTSDTVHRVLTLDDLCRQLTQGWAGALTDWAALGSLPADQAGKYQPACLPDAGPLPAQKKLHQAAPGMLLALAAILSSMQVKHLLALCMTV